MVESKGKGLQMSAAVAIRTVRANFVRADTRDNI
jgi:hypothetical protein